ncbi:MAG: bifunctional adenosylcobinamide kinase/adenosylcobinamide-phosphate guanylyltransferase [Syntrophales bacterium]|jgi:adenosylcobinamide kinase/adenosylcobinamide-phosphate guanylyltransferase|nr:bifunctional adenosylcobinamide kinase/adenosylcobinamide-phosphate guanylyltransferase [Syntrophales bacterium]
MIIFITGGARSGKSDFAQDLAEKRDGRRLFIATAQPFDEEMRRRIAAHRARRGDRWDTVEEPVHIGRTAGSAARAYETVLLDCMTLWLSNLMGEYPQEDEKAEEVIDEFFASLDGFAGTFIVIGNEVGLGVVPDNPLAREYRDRLGFLNQRMARKADRVYFMVAGIATRVK